MMRSMKTDPNERTRPMTATDINTLDAKLDELRETEKNLRESAERFGKTARRLRTGMSAGRARNNELRRLRQAEDAAVQIRAIEAVLEDAYREYQDEAEQEMEAGAWWLRQDTSPDGTQHVAPIV
jgi:chromosome segregation ATPase